MKLTTARQYCKKFSFVLLIIASVAVVSLIGLPSGNYNTKISSNNNPNNIDREISRVIGNCVKDQNSGSTQCTLPTSTRRSKAQPAATSIQTYRIAYQKPTIIISEGLSSVKLVRATQDVNAIPKNTIAITENKLRSRSSLDLAIGAPMIPFDPVNLWIPDDKEVVSIRVLPAPTIPISGSYDLDHSKEPMHTTDTKTQQRDPTPPNASIYSSNKPFPSAHAGSIRSNEKGKYKFVSINLFPVSYIPAKRSLSYSPYIEIKVKFATTPPTIASRNAIKLNSDRKVINRMIDNSFEIPELVTSRAAEDKGKYLIITNNRDVNGVFVGDLVGAFRSLINHKNTNGGFGPNNAYIVTMDTIRTHAGAEGINDDQDRIRGYIRDAYSTGVRWVLLGGDSNIVPARKVFVNYDGRMGDSGHDHIDYVASDVYYSSINGPWDGDRDGVWGEYNDGANGGDVDLLSDVYVGRAPVRTVTDVQNFVAKTIKYANVGGLTPHPNSKKVVLLGEELGQNNGVMYSGSYAYLYMKEHLSLADRFNLTERYDENGFWYGDDFLRDIAANPHFIAHFGHSWVHTNARLCATTIIPDNPNSLFSMDCGEPDSMDSLTNSYPYIMYSEGCFPGAFDLTTTSIGERHVVEKNGAVAVVMNSRYGWIGHAPTPGTYPSELAFSQLFEYNFWDFLFNQKESQLGPIHQLSNEQEISGVGETFQRYVYLETTLFGDPELSVQIDDMRSIAGKVTSTSGPVSGVAIRDDNSGTTATTNASGDYTLKGMPVGSAYTIRASKAGYTFAPASITGSLNVNATGKNFTATLIPEQTYTLRITKSGTGSGTVASTPGGISCGSVCTNTYVIGANTVVNLRPTPSADSGFFTWGGDTCSNAHPIADQLCTLTMNGNKTINVFFYKKGNELTVGKSGLGTGSVVSNPAGISCGSTCRATFDWTTAPNRIVTLTATAANDSTFTGWTRNGPHAGWVNADTICNAGSTCVVPIQVARSVTANFNANPQTQYYTLTVAKAGTGNGTVSSAPAGISNCSNTCSANYAQNTSVTLTATASAGSTFSSWGGVCSGTTGTTCTVAMNSAKSVTANFNASTLGEALDAPTLTWETGGDSQWFGQTTTSFNGSDAAQSGSIRSYAGSWIKTTVQGPGVLSFYWKTSGTQSQELSLYVDNHSTGFYISGNTTWQRVSLPVASGAHVAKWSFSSWSGSNTDTGWLDKVEFTK